MKFGLKRIIIISMIMINLFSIVSIFVYFSNYYYETMKSKIKNENLYASKVAKGILNDEMENILQEAGQISMDESLLYALKDNMYILPSDRLRYTDYFKSKNTIKVKKMNKLKFLRLISKLTKRLYPNKTEFDTYVSVYNGELKNKGYSQGFPKDFIDKGTEQYMKEALGNREKSINISGVEKSFIQYKNNVFFMKALFPVEGGFHYGVVVSGKKIDEKLLRKIKQNVNKEVILVKDNKILLTTIYKETLLLKDIDIDKEFSGEIADETYNEIIIDGINYGFNFFAIKDNNEKAIGYIGVGFEAQEMNSVLKNAVESFIKIILIFIVLIFITLLLILTKIFKPFDLIIKGLKEIEKGNYKNKIYTKSGGEIKKIVESINILSTEVEKREKELIEKNVQLENYDKLKDQFLANTSHELRTPLNGIIGIAESLVNGVTGKLSERTIKNLNLIVTSGKRLSKLVNDILDFSKIKEKDLKIRFKNVDISSAIDNVILLLKPIADEKNIFIKNDLPDEFPYIIGDEDRLQQILYNLIGNAIKFTKSGGVTLLGKYDNDKAELIVKDTGIGIPKDKFEDIFESFEQGDGSSSRKYGGTGLGLSITRKLIRLHKGTIEVKSELEVGSEFIVTLMIDKEKELIKKQRVKTSEGKTEKKSVLIENKDIKEINGDRILVVDDEQINIQVLVNNLSLKNFQIDYALNGKDALDLIEKNEYYLVILDVMMPEMSGFEVAERLRKKHTHFQLPILMLTAKNQIEDIIKGLKSGANDYLSKPFEKEELLSRVDNLVMLKKAVKNSIEKSKKYEQEKIQKELAQELSGVMKEVTSTFDINEVFEKILFWLKEFIFFEGAAGLLLEDDRFNEIRRIDNISTENIEEFINSKPAIIERISEMEKTENFFIHKVIGKSSNSYMFVPIISRKNVVAGILFCISEKSILNVRKFEIILNIFTQIGVALENARLINDVMEKQIELTETNYKLFLNINKVRNLINNSGEGFLTFNSDFVIDNEYSKECTRLIKEEIGEKSIFDTIFKSCNEVEYKMLKNIFTKVFEKFDQENLDFYYSLLRNEIDLNNYCVALKYHLISNAKENKIMIIMKDITEERKLKDVLNEERLNLKMAVKIVNESSDFISLIQSYNDFVKKDILEYFNNQESTRSILNKIFIKVHTFKGNFSQFLLRETEKKLFQLEDDLIEMKNRKDINIDLLKQEFLDKNLEMYVKNDLEMIKKIVGSDFNFEEEVLKIKKEKVEEFKNNVKEIFSENDYKKITKLIDKMKYKDLKNIIQKSVNNIQDIATDMYKSINRIEINGDEIEINTDIYDEFIKTLIHIFRNMIDHGIETPEERLEKNKDEKGNIKCNLKKGKNEFVIEIEDDGSGIDLESIKLRVKEKGLEIDITNESELLNVIFFEEFSSKDQISSISGRGVGLAAVKKALDNIDGTIKVETKKDFGTKFIIKLPIIE